MPKESLLGGINETFDWKRFAEVQANLPKVTKDGQGNYGAYMKLEDLNPAMIKLFSKHGFVWITEPSFIQTENGLKRTLRYRLVDIEGGGQISGEMDLVMAQDSPQAQGSAITYARRYALTAVTGLVADMDDDGQEAQAAADHAEEQERMKTKPIAVLGFYSTLKSKGVTEKEQADRVLDILDPTWKKLNTSGVARVQKQLNELLPDTIELILEGDHEASNATNQS